MENLTVDFSDLLVKFDITKIEYYAVYDPNTFTVIGIYPSHALEDKNNSILIDKELAESINEGRVRMSSCKFDTRSKKIEVNDESIVAVSNAVLQRILEKRWCSVVDYDIKITYSKKNKSLTFRMHDDYFNGTKQNMWPYEIILKYVVTSYNDPHVPHEIISFPLYELLDNKKKIFKKINLTDRFSIFSKNIFQYQMEIL
jgi:hypothetical protein